MTMVHCILGILHHKLSINQSINTKQQKTKITSTNKIIGIMPSRASSKTCIVIEIRITTQSVTLYAFSGLLSTLLTW